MKNKKLGIILIIVFSLLAIFLTFFMIGLINKKFKFPNFRFSGKVSSEIILEETYENLFNEIKLDVAAGNIEIKESEDSKIKVTIYGDKELLKYDDNDNKLYIKLESKQCIGFCFNQTINKVVIYLPQEYDEKINIENNYGDIEIGQFLKVNIDIREDCGDVSVLGGKEIRVKNNYGDIKIEEAYSVDLEESAGDINIGKVYDAKIENNLGDININEVLNFVDIEEDCGDIKIDSLTINENSNIINNLGDIKIGSTNEIYIDAETDLGDIKINENFRKSEITLSIKNDCGDIKVNN